MDRKSIEKLRLDRRLIGRKNWISPKEVEREIQALPDVSNKIAEAEEKANPADEGSPVADSSIPSQS